MLALVTLGLFSYRRLAIDMFPDVEIPVVSIITKYPGASPETVEREVSRRIEEAVNPIAGVKHVLSTSREGVSTVVVEFHLEIKINEATQEARAKINGIRGDLPQGIAQRERREVPLHPGGQLLEVPLHGGQRPGLPAQPPVQESDHEHGPDRDETPAPPQGVRQTPPRGGSLPRKIREQIQCADRRQQYGDAARAQHLGQRAGPQALQRPADRARR